MVSHLHKVIYVHPRKSGGSSIEAALDREERHNRGTGGALQCPAKHWTAAEIQARLQPAQWQSYFRFGTARNPWDRVHSWWWNTRKTHKGMDFTDWLQRVWLPGAVGQDQWALPSYTYMCDTSGRFCMHFVVSFEHLEEDAAHAFKAAGMTPRPLAHILHRPERPDYHEDYTAAGVEIVRMTMQPDIREWGYEF